MAVYLQMRVVVELGIDDLPLHVRQVRIRSGITRVDQDIVHRENGVRDLDTNFRHSGDLTIVAHANLGIRCGLAPLVCGRTKTTDCIYRQMSKILYKMSKMRLNILRHPWNAVVVDG